MAAGSVVGLYQMGLLKRLPDYPSRFFDATRVNASTYGYKFLESPDALLMMASYALTAILAGAGGKDRAQLSPALPIALAAKALTDVIVNLYLAKEEWRKIQALCGYRGVNRHHAAGDSGSARCDRRAALSPRRKRSGHPARRGLKGPNRKGLARAAGSMILILKIEFKESPHSWPVN